MLLAKLAFMGAYRQLFMNKQQFSHPALLQ